MSSRTSNDKPITKGVNADRLRQDAVRQRRAGWHEAIVPPSQEAIRAAIESQICPWCGKGPFAMLPVHTNKIHAIDKYELRDLAGLTTADPLSGEDARQRMRDHAATLTPQQRHERSARAAEKVKGKTKRPKRWTKAAKVSPVKAECVNGHRFSEENTRIGPGGKRECRACAAGRMRSLKAALRAEIVAESGPCDSVSISGIQCQRPLGHEGKHSSGRGARWSDATICDVDGCDLRAEKRGMCTKHYKRVRRLELANGGAA